MMRKYEEAWSKGTFNKYISCDGMTFEAHKQIVKSLSQTCNHLWACADPISETTPVVPTTVPETGTANGYLLECGGREHRHIAKTRRCGDG